MSHITIEDAIPLACGFTEKWWTVYRRYMDQRVMAKPSDKRPILAVVADGQIQGIYRSYQAAEKKAKRLREGHHG